MKQTGCRVDAGVCLSFISISSVAWARETPLFFRNFDTAMFFYESLAMLCLLPMAAVDSDILNPADSGKRLPAGADIAHLKRLAQGCDGKGALI